MPYIAAMHEMSIAESILSIVSDELKKHNCTKLVRVCVRYGAMAQVVPESLIFCFEAVTMNTPYAEARLELEELPVVLRCGQCQTAFTPEDRNLFASCPACGMNLGHSVEQGRELYVQHLEAE